MSVSESEYRYDADFFDYVDVGARTSARAVIREILRDLKVGSVLDVGCGRGAWLAEWVAANVDDVVGVDGDYVNRTALHIPSSSFRPYDVSRPFDLKRKFDFVQSLEVGEHLRPEGGDDFVDNLCRHADIVLFSAATPGQGGEHHVNERPLSYWHAQFRRRGYHAFDCVRPRILYNRDIEPWYRYNMLLYVRGTSRHMLSDSIRATSVDAAIGPQVLSPWWWRVRAPVLRLLPPGAVTRLAQIKHKAVQSASQRRARRTAGPGPQVATRQ